MSTSSHGSYKASTGDSPQPYGRNQVLLPLDTREAGLDDRGIPNGIVDVEIGRALDVIRAKGVHAWIVVDTCHAGDSTRAAAVEGVEARFVGPKTLGIAFDPSTANKSAPRGMPSGRGAAIDIKLGQGNLAPMVGFFAADALHLSQQQPFPSEAEKCSASSRNFSTGFLATSYASGQDRGDRG